MNDSAGRGAGTDVVVSGAHGLIGSALLTALAAGGLSPRRLVRGLPAAPGDVSWDPVGGTVDLDALAGCDAVVHLAGAGIGDRRWTPARKREILESRTLGTAAVADALARLEPRPSVMVCASAVGIYGDRGDELLDEESALGETGFLPEVCRAWEAATAAAAEAGIRVVLLRMGVVLSADGGLLRQLLLPFKAAIGGRLGDGEQYMSWITMPDVLRAVLHALRDDSLAGPVNATAPVPVTNLELTATLGRVLRRPTVLPVPLAPVELLYGKELVRELMLEGQRVVPAKLESAGLEFRSPELEAALRSVLGR